MGLAFHASQGATNLLQNSGFEEGWLGWSPDARHQIVESPAQVRSGRRCVVGSVDSSNQAARLGQSVPVRAGHAYILRLNARGDPGTKITLFARGPGSNPRRPWAAWEPLQRRWAEYKSAPLEIEQDGVLYIELIAPSSFGAAPGRVWLDDVVLEEIPTPRRVDLSGGVGFNDEPTLALSGDGALYVAWISFRDGADTLRAVRLVRDARGWQEDRAWCVATGRSCAVLSPRMVGTPDGAALVYAIEAGDDWQIAVSWLTTNGPALTRTFGEAGADTDPAVAAEGDRLWIAWEASRNGRRRIGVTHVHRQGLGPVEYLSRDEVNAYDPSIAVIGNGTVAVAWHDFRQGQVDIYLRTRLAGGSSWSPERQLTRAPTLDRHARLFTHESELWMIYETAQVKDYHVTATFPRRDHVVRILDDRLEEPAHGQGPLDEGSEAASAAWDSQGRLHVAWLKAPDGKPAGWNVHYAFWDGHNWSQVRWRETRKSMDRRPGVVALSNELVVAYQWDDMPRQWNSEADSERGTSHVALAVLPLDVPAQSERPLMLRPLQESLEPFPPLELRAARGEDWAGWTVTHQGQTWRLFFGDLHEHTDISPCGRVRDQSVDESYQHMRDLAVHDFACVTDHGYSLNRYLWHYTAKLARVNEDPGRFLTFLGEEWTSSFEEYSVEHPYGFYGHRNLVFADARFPRWWNARNRQTPAQVWEDLRRLGANFVSIPHQLADTGNVPTDWNFHDPVVQPVAEIFQTRGSYEHEGAERQASRTTPRGWFLQDAWARGIVIGVIASPDHGGGYGKAAVYAPELSRTAILDALRARRCYGTTGAKILLDVRVGGRFMGEVVAGPPPRPVPIQVTVRAPIALARVDVVRNNHVIYSVRGSGPEMRLMYEDRDVPTGRVWYYVRVVTTDQELAWSSPVWWGAQ